VDPSEAEVDVTVVTAGVFGWPFGIGVLLGPAPDDARCRDEERLGIALSAYKAGYFLIGTIDLAVEVPLFASELDRLSALVRRTGAEALFVQGGEPGTVLEELAADQRLVLRRVPAPPPHQLPRDHSKRRDEPA
jgi:hypothetical protein